jgi:DNA-directed RNA polymerase subunit M/transcription elongation factor TFIIS
MSVLNRVQELVDLRKALEEGETNRQLDALYLLADIPVNRDILKESGVAKIVGRLREKAATLEVRSKARELVDLWKKILDDDSRKKSSISTPNPVQTDHGEEEDLTTIFELPSTGNPKRDKVLDLLFVALRPRTDLDEREPVVVAIERSCWNALVSSKNNEKDYYAQIRSLRFNLTDPKNPDFRRKCLTGYFGDERWAKLRAEDMASVAWNEQREKMRIAALEECQSDWLMRHGGVQASGMFQCGKCKGSKTTYFQMQTRSADEPMTTFVTCLTCKNKWKFC